MINDKTILDFVPPSPSHSLISLAQVASSIYDTFESPHVDIADDVRASFAELEGKHTIICPNHPSSFDSLVLFILSARVHEEFAFLTAREIFGETNSLRYKWLQKLGCYSVERGASDTKAFKATRQLLTDGTRKVVIFPEGEITYENEHLAEFQNGAELMPLAALNRLEQCGSDETVYLLPLVLKYQYSKDIGRELGMIMQQVESSLGIKHHGMPSLKSRILSAYKMIVETLEESHGTDQTASASLSERLNAVCKQLISEVEAFLNVRLQPGLTQLSRVHLLTNAFTAIENRHENKEASFGPDHDEAAVIYRNQLKRVVKLLSLAAHDFEAETTQEEAAELIRVLVQESSGILSMRPPDVVHIGAGEIINVRHFQPVYERDMKQSVVALKSELEKCMELRLARIQHDHKSIYVT